MAIDKNLAKEAGTIMEGLAEFFNPANQEPGRAMNEVIANRRALEGGRDDL